MAHRKLVDPASEAFGGDGKPIIKNHTESASANVVLTSAVGTTRKRWAQVAGTSATQSAGRKSIAFISTTQTKTVSAAGV